MRRNHQIRRYQSGFHDVVTCGRTHHFTVVVIRITWLDLKSVQELMEIFGGFNPTISKKQRSVVGQLLPKLALMSLNLG